MSKIPVFDSKINELIEQMNALKKLKVDPGFLSNLLSIFGRGSVSEEALTAHNKLIDKTIQSYTDNMNALLKLTKQMEHEGLNNNVIMERMSEQIEKLRSAVGIQEASIQRSQKIITNYKNTITQLEKDNTAIQEANKTLTSQNERQQKQNEEQNTTNQKLTSQNKAQQEQNEAQQKQNKAQQEQIANLENNLKELNEQLKTQTDTLEQQANEITKITKSNTDLSTQLKKLKATQAKTDQKIINSRFEIVNLRKAQEAQINKINTIKKMKVLFLKNSAKNRLNLQRRVFLNRIAEIKENSNNSIADKEAKIKEITEQHTKAQNEINTQLTNLTATSSATIGDLKKELSSFKTEEKLSKENQEKQKKMLNTVTRVFPLSWNNSKGFNIGNITTQVRGEKPYSATDTIDYYLHTLFKGETPIGEPRDIISSKQVPIRGILKETSGGKKNRMKKSKKSNKSKNNKTKKQRGKW
jgi:myosin heavy subunit